MKAAVLLALGGLAWSFGWPDSQPETTYQRDIKPIFQNKCVACHCSGGPAPFDFSTYDGIKPRIELIMTQALSKNMPPVWVHSSYGSLAKVESLTDQELVLLQQWLAQKMPQGEVTGPEAVIRSRRWPKGQGTLVKPQGRLRKEGVPYWRVHTVDLPPKGGALQGFDLEPNSRPAFGSALVAIVPKSMKLPKETAGSLDLSAKYLVGTWAPGYRQWMLPKSISLKYPPNSKLVVQTLLKPTGKAEDIGFRVQLFPSTAKPSPRWISLEKKPLLIPAGKSPQFDLKYPIDRDTDLISLIPEARFYAGKVQLLCVEPDGSEKTVYENIRWDPFWMGNYMFETPVRLKKGSVLIARFFYNNDDKCRMNEGQVIHDIKNGPTAGDEVCRMHLLVGP